MKEDYIESQMKIINIMVKNGYNKDELIKLLQWDILYDSINTAVKKTK